MKTILSLLLISTNLLAKPIETKRLEVIYGEDGREDSEMASDPALIKMSRSVAARISKRKLIFDSETGLYPYQAKVLADKGICKEERFSDQIATAECTGFLVGEDLLVTAGHCVVNLDCESNWWVFDYKLEGGDNPVFAEPNNVYSCSKVISQELDQHSGLDYALIKLDRKVINREPLKFRTEEKISDNPDLVVIGHPSGLPLKITSGGTIRDNWNPISFQANLDTYGGNSGSPVFDVKTGLVEGILVRGHKDYEPDLDANCLKSVKCMEGECDGEVVTRITNVAGLIPKLTKPSDVKLCLNQASGTKVCLGDVVSSSVNGLIFGQVISFASVSNVLVGPFVRERPVGTISQALEFNIETLEVITEDEIENNRCVSVGQRTLCIGDILKSAAK